MATFRVRSYASGTGKITPPSGRANGDALLLFQFFGKGKTPSGQTPAGWTNYTTGLYSTRRTITYKTSRSVKLYTVTNHRTVYVTVTTKTLYRTVTSYYLSYKITWTVTTIRANWTGTTATFHIVVDLIVPSTKVTATGTTGSPTFEDLFVARGTTTSGTIKVTVELTNDLVFIFCCTEATGETITLPAGGTAIGSTTTGTSAKAAYYTPGAGAHTETITISTASSAFRGAVVLTAGTPPSAPTLVAPKKGAFTTVTTGVTFTATYYSTTDRPQNGYAFRIKTSTSASYKYWNATTSAFQSTVVWNTAANTPGKNFSVTVAKTHGLTNSKEYAWSMATRTSVFNKEGAFATTFQFFTAKLPTVTVTRPTGTISTARPTVKFTWTCPTPGYVLTTYRIVVYTSAQHSAATFSPGVTKGVFDTGTVV